MDTDPHGNQKKCHSAMLLLICVLSLLAAQPAAVQTYAWSEQALELVPFRPSGVGSPAAAHLDLNSDGRSERLQYDGEKVSVLQGDLILWTSPAGWRVLKALPADLNRDGETELVLLVARRYRELPINQYVAVPWDHPAYKDGDFTYHLILIGGTHAGVGELWAGSGLVRPMDDIFAADLDGDGRCELVGVERNLAGIASGGDDHDAGAPGGGNTADELTAGELTDSGKTAGVNTAGGNTAGAVSIWEWTGFTFSLLERRYFSQLQQVRYLATPDRGLLLISGQEEPNDFKE